MTTFTGAVVMHGVASASVTADFTPSLATVTRVAGGVPNPPAQALHISIRTTALESDRRGGYYVVGSNAIEEIDAAGVVHTVAGSGAKGSSGDGGPAVSALLDHPTDVAVDQSGNVYIVDSGNYEIRRISPDGVIRTVAGTGFYGVDVDGNSATSTSMAPTHVAVRPDGSIVFVDAPVYGPPTLIRQVGVDGRVSTLVHADASSLASDVNGNVYATVHDGVRRIDTHGTMTVFAGVAGSSGFAGDGGSATQALLSGPSGVAMDTAGNVYVADTGNQRIRRIASNGIITSVVGNGRGGYSGDGGPPLAAMLGNPSDVAVDAAGNVLIADTYNAVIRRVTSGVISTVAGNGLRSSSGDGGQATSAQLDLPQGLVRDAAGNVYVTEYNGAEVRRISPAGIITTVAGTGIAGFSGDGGSARSAQLDRPLSLAIDRAQNLYIADLGNARVRKVTPAGVISTVVGTGSYGAVFDGQTAVTANIDSPLGVAIAPNGVLYVSTLGSNLFEVEPSGQIFNLPQIGNAAGLAVDRNGDLLVTSPQGNQLLRLTSAGVVSVVAGDGIGRFRGDGGPASAAELFCPTAVTVDDAGDIAIVDSVDNRVRVIDPTTGTIASQAQSGTDLSGGDPNQALCSFTLVGGILSDLSGGWVVSDPGNDRVVRITYTADDPPPTTTPITEPATAPVSPPPSVTPPPSVPSPWRICSERSAQCQGYSSAVLHAQVQGARSCRASSISDAWVSARPPTAVVDAYQVGDAANEETFVAGTDGNVYHDYRSSPGHWSGWSSLSGPPGGIVGSVRAGNNYLGHQELYTVSTNGEVYHLYATPGIGSGWRGWDSLGAPVAGIDGDVFEGTNFLHNQELYVLGNDGDVFHKYSTPGVGTGWSNWDSLGHPVGVTLVGQAQVGTNYRCNQEIYVTGADGQTYHTYSTPGQGTGWSRWSSLGAPPGGGRGFTSAGENFVDNQELFSVGTDGNVYHDYSTPGVGSGWSGWGSLGAPPGQIVSPSVWVDTYPVEQLTVWTTLGEYSNIATPGVGSGWTGWLSP